MELSRAILRIGFALVLITGPIAAMEIDLSISTDPDAELDINFFARPSPGEAGKAEHAFVAFSRKSHDR